MDITNIQNINQVSHNVQTGKVLKEGSSVLVRIIADKGNNKYEASVAGIRVEVSAKNPLKPGQVFAATASSKNGVIQINPESDLKADLIKTVLVENAKGETFSLVTNPQTQALLQSMGMIPDNLSLAVFNQLKQLGMKIDSAFLSKVYNLSVKFKGKEKQAAEIMLLLKQKGIDFSEEEIQQLLSQLEYNNENQNKSDGQKDDDYNYSGLEIKQLLENYLKEIWGCNNKTGLFTIMNHLGWKKDKSGNGSWIILPFELINNSTDEKKINGTGNIKIFLDNQKRYKFIHLNCSFNNKQYNLKLENNKNQINIKMNIQGNNIDFEKESDKLKTFIKTDKKINIDFAEKNEAEGFGAGLEEMISVGGLV